MIKCGVECGRGKTCSFGIPLPLFEHCDVEIRRHMAADLHSSEEDPDVLYNASKEQRMWVDTIRKDHAPFPGTAVYTPPPVGHTGSGPAEVSDDPAVGGTRVRMPPIRSVGGRVARDVGEGAVQRQPGAPEGTSRIDGSAGSDESPFSDGIDGDLGGCDGGGGGNNCGCGYHRVRDDNDNDDHDDDDDDDDDNNEGDDGDGDDRVLPRGLRASIQGPPRMHPSNDNSNHRVRSRLGAKRSIVRTRLVGPELSVPRKVICKGACACCGTPCERLTCFAPCPQDTN